MKKIFLFIFVLACFACFSEENYAQRRLRVRNERLTREQETTKHKMAKEALIKSKEVMAISNYKFNSKSCFTTNFFVINKIICFIAPKRHDFNKDCLKRH